MSSESETTQAAESQCLKAVTHLDQVINAIKALRSPNGSTRDEICDYLVARDLMNEKIAKALVSKALYKGMDEGLVKRPKGTNKFIVLEKKHTRRHRHSTRRSAAAAGGSNDYHDQERRHEGRRKHRHHHKDEEDIEKTVPHFNLKSEIKKKNNKRCVIILFSKERNTSYKLM
ncbi:hypothetical protein Btru_058302 [Bulinus truncatus]|nr:hypothetical protein Btru_058302 [Bulinus truncatus]